MTVKYGKFEMPTKIQVEETDSSTFARFVAEPFEKGFAHTFGNSLRRIMLSSLEAPAIISVKMEGVSHEYMAIDGIVEDMTNIVLNLKEALLKTSQLVEKSHMRNQRVISKVLDITAEDLEKGKGQYHVKLSDVISDSFFELVNPDHYLFTVTKPMSKKIDFRVAINRGYTPSERVLIEEKHVGEIVIDAIFSPVRIVTYHAENTRVGQDTDYDRLILEVKTDGRISPQEAIHFASQIAVKHLEVFNQKEAYELSFEEDEDLEDKGKDELLQKLILRIDEIELSVRSANCLRNADIQSIAELVIKPESEMLRFRNFGRKSLNEIKDKLVEMSLCLGMDLSPYGIYPENVRETVQKFIDEKAKQEAKV